MKKTLQKPVNWQDFEELCKKIWWEVWDCPSIKKNGRIGQAQHGVDIFGIPKGQEEYFGIQCKGKDDYTNSKLTPKEIDDEIEKAKCFQPALKSFIFATSANKDSSIEEYIRIKNVENKKNGLFDVDIFSWEDLVDLIEQYQYVYEWYSAGSLHRRQNEIEILLNDMQGTIDKPITLSPKYTRQLITYVPKPKTFSLLYDNDHMESILKVDNIFDFDNSYIELCFSLNNVGRSVYEEVYFSAKIEESSKLKFREEGLWALKNWYNVNDNVIAINSDAKLNIKVDMSANLVGNVKLPNEEFNFKINWFFTSKHSVSSLRGTIYCAIKPEIMEIEPEIREIKGLDSERQEWVVVPQKNK